MAGMFGARASYAPQNQTLAERAFGLSAPDLGVLGGSIKDAIAYFSGHPQEAVNLAPAIQQGQQYNFAQGAMQARQAAMAKFQAATTPQEEQAAALALWGSGGDMTGLSSALNVGKPEIKAYGIDQDLFSVDPLTGQQTLVRKGSYKPTPNQPFNPDGTANMPFQNYQRGLYRARAEANSDFRAPRASASGAISLPHPGSMY